MWMCSFRKALPPISASSEQDCVPDLTWNYRHMGPVKRVSQSEGHSLADLYNSTLCLALPLLWVCRLPQGVLSFPPVGWLKNIYFCDIHIRNPWFFQETCLLSLKLIHKNVLKLCILVTPNYDPRYHLENHGFWFFYGNVRAEVVRLLVSEGPTINYAMLCHCVRHFEK